MQTTLEQFMAKSPQPSFEAKPQYFADGDYVSYFVDDELYYAQRLDEHVTVYVSEKTGQMIGCKIKSVSHLLKNLGDFSVSITDHDHEISLGLLFLTAATLADLSKRERYMEIARKLGKAPLDRSTLPQAA